MPEELNLAIQQICDEKGLSLDMVKETIEEALSAAYRKDFGDKKTQNIKVKFDLATGDFEVFDVKEIVEDELKAKYDKIKEEIEKLKAEGKEISEETMKEIQDKFETSNLKFKTTEKTKSKDRNKKQDNGGTQNEKEAQNKNENTEKKSNNSQLDNSQNLQLIEEEKKFNPRTMISLSDARLENKKAEIGEQVIKQLEVPADFGRMAAQTAKQVIIQKLREAERNNIFNNFKNKIGELINGTIQRLEGRVVLVDLGPAIGVVIPQDQSKQDNYKSGARMKFYVRSVEQTARGPEILLSRTHPEILRRLFKLEVPEINLGTVQIKAIARDAGFRSKIAVATKENNLDPIGACIGQRGTRVQTVINELGGEKIDIIEWNENLEKFIINALAPAKILKVEVDQKNRIAKAFVKEDQYSLAIGREGQNVRLAAQLVGYKIEVVMEKEENNIDKNSDKIPMNADSADEKTTTEESKKDKEIDEKEKNGFDEDNKVIE